jgi:hypothetical protein
MRCAKFTISRRGMTILRLPSVNSQVSSSDEFVIERPEHSPASARKCAQVRPAPPLSRPTGGTSLADKNMNDVRQRIR